RNGKDRVVGVGVGICIVAIAEVSGVVVVQQVVVPRFTIGLNRCLQRLQVGDDRSYARLRCIRAVGVRSAPVGRCAKGAAAVTVFCVPVVGVSSRIGVLYLVHNARILCARGNFNI